MTNEQMNDIYRANLGNGHTAALRSVWNAGWYQGASKTPAADSADVSGAGMAKPAAVITKTKR